MRIDRFFDPNGHRLELTIRRVVPTNAARDAQRILEAVAGDEAAGD